MIAGEAARKAAINDKIVESISVSKALVYKILAYLTEAKEAHCRGALVQAGLEQPHYRAFQPHPGE